MGSRRSVGKRPSGAEIIGAKDFAVVHGRGPGVVVDGKLVHAGGLPKPENVRTWLKGG